MMIGAKDIKLPVNRPKELILDKHEKYLKKYANDDTDTDQIFAEYLKMSGMYWGLNALYIMRALNENSTEVSRALTFIKDNQTAEGGFAASYQHDPHILHTLSAVQMLVILDKLDSKHIDIDKCVDYVKSLQQKDGSFFGDKWGEVDTRFSFCALATLKLLGRLNDIDVDKAVEFVLSCNNQIDGGFGSKPGSESHSAYVYCCVGCLAITGNLDKIDTEQLGWWLSERQLPSGGLNGRPEKLPDVCYSWWCLSSLQMINKMHLIDHKRLMTYILACQDIEKGGFSDRPGNQVDPYHTMFGVASISLICRHFNQNQASCDVGQEFLETVRLHSAKLKLVNPILCMPEDRIEKIL